MIHNKNTFSRKSLKNNVRAQNVYIILSCMTWSWLWNTKEQNSHKDHVAVWRVPGLCNVTINWTYKTLCQSNVDAIWKDAFQVTILSELSAILADMLSLALLRS